MNTRAYLILFLFLLWSFGSGWYYVCKIKQKCNSNTEISTTQNPLIFNFSDDKPIETPDFGVYKESLMSKLSTTNKLKIVGKFGALEENLSSFENLGIARAAAVRNLFPELDDSRFILSSKEIEITQGKADIEGAELEIALHNEFVNQTEFGAIIHFPPNAKNGEITPEIDEYLNVLVSKHKNNDIDIVGHTDDEGKEGDNFSLAMARASSIKDELIAKGMPVEKINALSKGETEPLADNSTEEGRMQNRRVEIIIND